MTREAVFYEQTRRQLARLGLPDADPPATTGVSGQSFPDGGHFRVEVPTVNSLHAAETLLAESRRRGFTINRITETRGMYRHTAREIAAYTALGTEYGSEILMSVGPRAGYDIGAGVQTPEGMRIGYRLRGQEQLIRAIEDVKRGIELGVRGFVVYDEGLLWALGRLRAEGDLPAGIHLKVSAHCGQGNPAAARLLETLGADSFNPVRDLTLPMIAALRQAVSIPLDCHVDNPRSSGGFIRTYEASDIVRVAAPVYLKTGNSALDGHGTSPSSAQLDDILRQVEIVVEFLGRHYPAARQSPTARQGATDDHAPTERLLEPAGAGTRTEGA
ncbi:peptidase [Streptomyces sp. WMMC1477]|uniref:peptidase n=1 Tax=Streptomyces sp. WMMC1477 TaxID=3015155 RepID=UPI0022B610EA|nr:peptidase [Streptomyces sp. WMMC1477]MCZ7430715.1 peptidase [Streptomyces sp. WMMC1477]